MKQTRPRDIQLEEAKTFHTAAPKIERKLHKTPSLPFGIFRLFFSILIIFNSLFKNYEEHT